jgi:Zn-dependent M28 family amino/carboxypeptidase
MRTVSRLALLSALLLVAGWSSCGTGRSGPPAVERPAFDAQEAFRLLEQQVSFGPRTPGSAAHEEARAYLLGKLKETAREAFEQRFQATTALGGPYRFANLIGLYGPANGRKLMLSAHWDSRPVADEDPNPANRTKPVPGADDGASGVAVLLEMARRFAEKAPPIPVIIALWDAEDSGKENSALPLQGYCIGSSHFVRNMPTNARPDEVILLDMVGGDSRPNPRVGTRAEIGGNNVFDLPEEGFSKQSASALLEEVWSTALRLGHTAFQRREGFTVIDDHVPFIAQRIPAIDIIEFDYPEWHTVDDTPDHCDPASLLQVGETLMEVVYARKG